MLKQMSETCKWAHFEKEIICKLKKYETIKAKK